MGNNSSNNPVFTRINQLCKNFYEEQKPRIKEFRFSLYLFKKNRLAVAGLIIILAFIIIAIFAPWIAPYDPEETDFPNKKKPPSRKHLFGTDQVGRDILSRIFWGARIDLAIGIIIVGIGLIIGIALGATSGYMGGKVDEIIMRVTDVFLAFPFLILAMAVTAAFGMGLKNMMIALVLVSWPGYTRLVRGQALSVKENEYVEAARAVGASNSRIIFKHILPNCMAPITVRATMDLGVIILIAAGLGFIGVGAGPEVAEWGRMISDGRDYVFAYPWIPTFPGLAILIVVLGFNLLGDGLRDILDPRLRR